MGMRDCLMQNETRTKKKSRRRCKRTTIGENSSPRCARKMMGKPLEEGFLHPISGKIKVRGRSAERRSRTGGATTLPPVARSVSSIRVGRKLPQLQPSRLQENAPNLITESKVHRRHASGAHFGRLVPLAPSQRSTPKQSSSPEHALSPKHPYLSLNRSSSPMPMMTPPPMGRRLPQIAPPGQRSQSRDGVRIHSKKSRRMSRKDSCDHLSDGGFVTPRSRPNSLSPIRSPRQVHPVSIALRRRAQRSGSRERQQEPREEREPRHVGAGIIHLMNQRGIVRSIGQGNKEESLDLLTRNLIADVERETGIHINV
mmetsp:Transcript_27616/g.51506  ORF Transcript_27616/g.51506 Transcript_27616/m.51506 type:complete len:313 (+) Transcript_27616:152-1090(+)